MILNANQGWRFFRVDSQEDSLSCLDYYDAGKDDTSWKIVNLPHSVRLEPYHASGGRNFQGVCYYRRHFDVDEHWNGKKLFLKFGGAMQVADIFLNGRLVTTHYGGYLPFVIDITDLVKYGKRNLLSLRLDNRNQPLVPPGKPQEHLDFTYFGGLYRGVTMIITDPLHITDPLLSNTVAGGGIFVTYPKVSASHADIEVKTEIFNECKHRRTAVVRQELIDDTGHIVASVSSGIVFGPGTTKTLVQKFGVTNPKLWHPDHPNLYNLNTTVCDGESVIDHVSTRIGIRSLEISKSGVKINGENFLSSGFNHHQDYLYIGYAVPNSLQYRDVRKMREAGLTSFRSHYPHDEAFMDACDELGVLTIISTPGWQWWPDNELFNDRAYKNTRDMVRINRNRPSVILWEVGLNETRYTREFAENSHKIVHEEFPVHPCYTSGDGYAPWQTSGDPVFDVLYAEPAFPARRPVWMREWSDNVDMNWGDQISDNRVSRAMGEYAMLRQAAVHQDKLSGLKAHRHHQIGYDIWTGIDCDRGYHPIPYLGGLLDKARLPKFSYYAMASLRPLEQAVPGIDDGPMVFIANLMTRYSPRDITVYSNCEEVRLIKFQQKVDGEGESVVATLPVKPWRNLIKGPVVFHHVLDRLDRWRLKAQGLVGGKVVVEQTTGAAGAPKKIKLAADNFGKDLIADGSDIIALYATIQDGNGYTVTFDDRYIKFTVTGPASIIGDSSIGANPCKTEIGTAPLLIQSHPCAGEIMVKAEAIGLEPAFLRIKSSPYQGNLLPGRDVGLVWKQADGEAPSYRVSSQPGEEEINAQARSQDIRDSDRRQPVSCNL